MRRREVGRIAGGGRRYGLAPAVGRRRVNPRPRTGAALAGVVSQTAHSGGVGAPPGVTTDPCQELADGGAVAFRKEAEPPNESAARRRKENAANATRMGESLSGWSAERRAPFAKGRAMA